ncbi:MAG: TIGR01212 family radical SAM protein [Halanaerobiales bacterium]
MSRYYKYSQYLKDLYGVKTYKISLNLPLTCPNRDGSLGTGGCDFCGETGGVFSEQISPDEIKKQFLETRENIRDKYGAKKFIAYYQNFTNTYQPLEQLKEYITPVIKTDDLVEVVLSTRPDCINDRYLTELTGWLKNNNPEVNLGLELGLQTVNYHTLEKINRGHTLAEFIDTVLRAQKHNIKIGVHLILNLPGDKRIDAVENARILSALKVDNVKLHALYIRKGTRLAKKYKAKKLKPIPFPEYRERVISFLKHLAPDIAIQRLLGNAPEEETLFLNWGKNRWKLRDSILKEMENRETKQGDKCNYLNGKALKYIDK